MRIVIVFLIALLSKTMYAQDFNYEEDKVGTYELPELLITLNGKKVKNKADWENMRREEVIGLFQEHIYGKVPTDFDRIEFHVIQEDPSAMNGDAYLKEINISVFRNNASVSIHLILFTPNHKKNAVPAFLLINNRSVRNTSPSRDTISDFWPAEKIIQAGYAIASFQVNDAAPDNKDTFQNGMLHLYPELLDKDDGIKTIGAWAWAASRVMDYFEKDDAVNAEKTALIGHSRGGKAALWAAAEDARFGICIANNSGNTGAALSRRNFGETVQRINTKFPHWFNDNYKKYNNKESLLPVDQHMLIALIAPRPVYITSASEDLWADPKGMFLALKNAEPVYELYDRKSTVPEKHPKPNRPIYRSPLGYHIREGEHNLTEYDWTQFIKFVDFHF
ncbi:MAG TPA: hypothetical protein VK102_05600 [Sphingobacterium sp.]|nr:hypothetical protein [Sphingobacterium sp.]